MPPESAGPRNLTASYRLLRARTRAGRLAVELIPFGPDDRDGYASLSLSFKNAYQAADIETKRPSLRSFGVRAHPRSKIVTCDERYG